ncbi:MAG: hypothetical protein ACRC5C_00770, partial [Bacilli bacterium]
KFAFKIGKNFIKKRITKDGVQLGAINIAKEPIISFHEEVTVDGENQRITWANRPNETLQLATSDLLSNISWDILSKNNLVGNDLTLTINEESYEVRTPTVKELVDIGLNEKSAHEYWNLNGKYILCEPFIFNTDKVWGFNGEEKKLFDKEEQNEELSWRPLLGPKVENQSVKDAPSLLIEPQVTIETKMDSNEKIRDKGFSILVSCEPNSESICYDVEVSINEKHTYRLNNMVGENKSSLSLEELWAELPQGENTVKTIAYLNGEELSSEKKSFVKANKVKQLEPIQKIAESNNQKSYIHILRNIADLGSEGLGIEITANKLNAKSIRYVSGGTIHLGNSIYALEATGNENTQTLTYTTLPVEELKNEHFSIESILFDITLYNDDIVSLVLNPFEDILTDNEYAYGYLADSIAQYFDDYEVFHEIIELSEPEKAYEDCEMLDGFTEKSYLGENDKVGEVRGLPIPFGDAVPVYGVMKVDTNRGIVFNGEYANWKQIDRAGNTWKGISDQVFDWIAVDKGVLATNFDDGYTRWKDFSKQRVTWEQIENALLRWIDFENEEDFETEFVNWYMLEKGNVTWQDVEDKLIRWYNFDKLEDPDKKIVTWKELREKGVTWRNLNNNNVTWLDFVKDSQPYMNSNWGDINNSQYKWSNVDGKKLKWKHIKK